MVQNSIFISYKRLDEEFARELYQKLSERGYSPWLDVEYLEAGKSWDREIEQALAACGFLILLMSPEALESPEVRAEFNYFLGEGKPVIPLLLRDCDTIPYRLRQKQRIDFRYNRAKAYDALFKVLAAQSLESGRGPSDERTVDQAAITSVNWDQVEHAAALFTKNKIDERYEEKYNARCHLPRQSIHTHVESFLSGTKRVLILTGKAGTGKSSAICHLASQASVSKRPLWLHDCEKLDFQGDLANYIMETLGLPPAMVRVFEHLQVLDPSKQVVIVFDAVNENSNAPELLRKIQALVERTAELPSVKFIITCRMPIWSMLKRHLDLPSPLLYQSTSGEGVINVDNFDDDEIERAFELYRDAFGLQTTYNELSEQVKTLLRQPLFLKLTAAAYEEQPIPPNLALAEVFRKYIEQALGEEGFQGAAYTVLARLIELMYQEAQKELSVRLIENDSVIGEHVTTLPRVDPGNPFMRLLDEGVVSQQESLVLQRIEHVFVTYERVFEYLLADIVIGTEHIEKVVDVLEEATNRGFPALQGAAELAVCFHLLRDKRRHHEIDWLVQLAEMDRVGSRQFLISIIQTIHETGQAELVELILDKLSVSSSAAANLVAVQAAYSLKLDKYLVSLSLSKNPVLKDTAAVYIYERWNQDRLRYDIETAYKIVDKLTDEIKIKFSNPRRIGSAFSTLIVLSFHVFSHIIDQPEAVMPLFEFYQNAARRIPGLRPDSQDGGLVSAARNRGISVFLTVVAQVVTRVMESTIFQNNEVIEDLLKSSSNKQTMLKMSDFIDLDTLEGAEDELIECLCSPNPMVPWLFRGVMMTFIHTDPDTHVPLLSHMFYDDRLSFIGKFDIAISIVFGALVRLLQHQELDMVVMEEIESMFDELWDDYHAVVDGIDAGVPVPGVAEMTTEYHHQRMEALLTGIYAIEAISQERDDVYKAGSEFLRQFVDYRRDDIGERGLRILIRGLEKFAYRMRPEFALRSMLDADVCFVWDRNETLRNVVVESLSRLRAFYQEEVDTLVQDFERQHHTELLEQVRNRGALPIAHEVRSMNNSLWTSALTIDRSVMKVAGAVLFDLARSEKVSQFVENAIRTVVKALYDVEDIDVVLAAWFLAHDLDWASYDKWRMRDDVAARKADRLAEARQLVEEYIKDHGTGSALHPS